jgi:hypothetical protein
MVTLAPGTKRILERMERPGAIEDRLIAHQILINAKKSELKLQTESEEIKELTFAPNISKSPPQRVDVVSVSKRLYESANKREEEYRLLQVSSICLYVSSFSLLIGFLGFSGRSCEKGDLFLSIKSFHQCKRAVAFEIAHEVQFQMFARSQALRASAGFYGST